MSHLLSYYPADRFFHPNINDESKQLRQVHVGMGMKKNVTNIRNLISLRLSSWMWNIIEFEILSLIKFLNMLNCKSFSFGTKLVISDKDRLKLLL